VASLGLDKMSWKGQLGVFVGIALAAAGAFYYFYEMPRQADMDVQRVELEAVRGRVAKGRETARQLPEFKAQIGDMQTRLEGLKPILPDERDVGDLLRRVQTLATQSNLTILGFKPQAITAREIHAEWPIGLELEGTFHDLGAFLDRVSKFPRIINIGGLNIRPIAPARTSDGAPESANTITVSATATTFVLVDQASPDSTKKGAPAKKSPATKTE
jgi:type IV pilus assembly protein PilO